MIPWLLNDEDKDDSNTCADVSPLALSGLVISRSAGILNLQIEGTKSQFELLHLDPYIPEAWLLCPTLVFHPVTVDRSRPERRIFGLPNTMP